jgi:hypothetical protein
MIIVINILPTDVGDRSIPVPEYGTRWQGILAFRDGAAT